MCTQAERKTDEIHAPALSRVRCVCTVCNDAQCPGLSLYCGRLSLDIILNLLTSDYFSIVNI